MPAFFAEALGEAESWSTANEIRERLERYDAAFAELEAKGLLGEAPDGRGGEHGE